MCVQFLALLSEKHYFTMKQSLWLIAYTLVLIGLAGYGFHRLMTIFLYWKHSKDIPQPKRLFDEQELPKVTIQLPVFNEMYCVERLISCVEKIDYPKDKLEIQLLDDSTDATTEICYAEAERLRQQGFDAICLHRTDRTGFKAGALELATKVAKGDFLFILDADFVPNEDVLRKTMHFFSDEKIGLVQTCWGHLNWDSNILTRVQAIFLDGHFQLEQTSRNRSGRFFTFNGTAGIWRKSTIEEAGGWEHDTLTEDMDLSYRAQMKGWQFVFLRDVVTPAELPMDMDGFKAQQHRWSKGSIQVCQKMLFTIWKSSAPLKAKMEATAHLTANYSYLLLIILCFLLYPVAVGGAIEGLNSEAFKIANAVLFFFASICVCIFYVVAQMIANPKCWWKRVIYLPILLALGIGMAVNNAKAVIEAIFGHQSSFVRTPKFGVNQGDKMVVVRKKTNYKAIKSIMVPVLELGFGAFFLYIIAQAFLAGRYGSVALLLPFMGFFYTSFSSLGRILSPLFERKTALEKH